jgi:hypothetical protein
MCAQAEVLPEHAIAPDRALPKRGRPRAGAPQDEDQGVLWIAQSAKNVEMRFSRLPDATSSFAAASAPCWFRSAMTIL